LSALPYLLRIIFSIPAAWVADGLVRKEIAARGIIRKSFALVASLGPALCLVGLSFTNCNQALAIVWLCIAVMLSGANNSGMNVKLQKNN
jgi:ACS family sodium-dependent inorganic phosphate cotransporter